MSKDFERYAYFISKASNYSICLKPDVKKIIDGEPHFTSGLRIDFINGMRRIEKTSENKIILKFLRDRIEKEKDLPQKVRSLWEEDKPKETVDKDIFEEAIAAKDAEIIRLKEDNKVNQANPEVDTENEIQKQSTENKITQGNEPAKSNVVSSAFN